MFRKIRSNKILGDIFGKMRFMRKLKIVIYNKEIQKRLYITQETFETFNVIKQMNQKFNLNIKDIDQSEIKIDNQNGTEVMEYMNKIGFNNLSELNLQWNNINDLTPLEKRNFSKLEKLNLNFNFINEINSIIK